MAKSVSTDGKQAARGKSASKLGISPDGIRSAGIRSAGIRSAGAAPWRGLAAAVLSALLGIAAYPPWGLWPLAFVAYVPLLAWIETERPTLRRAAQAGWLTGMLLHLSVYTFLVFTMQAMSGFPLWLAWLVHLIYAVAMGLHQALFAWAARLLGETPAATARQALLRVGALALLYAAIEFIVPFLFPWHLGNAFFRTPILMQPADLVGICGVSLLTMAFTALLALALARPALRKPLVASAALLLGLWLGYGALRLQQVAATPVRRVLRTALVQGNATIAEKLAEGKQRMAMMERAVKLTRALDMSQLDLVIWPEGALPFFYPTDAVGEAAKVEAKLPTRAPPILRQMKQQVLDLVREINRPILFGTLRRPDRMWIQEVRNAAILAFPDGHSQFYDKRILLPFGEYLPGTSLFPSLKEAIPGVSNMDPGTVSGLMTVAGTKLLVNICYEALFPAFLRREAGDADVLVNLTNDIWFGPDPAPTLHLMVQQARAVELRRPLLRSTVTGITVHVDAAGVLHEPTPLFSEATRRYDAQVRDIASPYRWWGDAPMWILTLFAVALVAVQWRRRAPRT